MKENKKLKEEKLNLESNIKLSDNEKKDFLNQIEKLKSGKIKILFFNLKKFNIS